MGRPPRALFVFAIATACTPALKPGTDRADASTADVSTDVPALPDIPRDTPADVPRDTPADAPRSPTAQRSCPDVSERGCGLVEIAGGTFTLGSADSSQAVDGSPAQPAITVGPFAIDAYEVTVARFRRFWAVASTLPPVGTLAYPGGSLRISDPVREPDGPSAEPACNWTRSTGLREAHPINCVDWPTAQAFCAWDGGRLATDAEWEFAARGRDAGGLRVGRLYPWGDDDPSLACDRLRWNLFSCMGDDGPQTKRVGTHAPSPDVEGARIWDLAGNIYEWTADSFVPYDDSDGSHCWGALATGRRNPLCNVPASNTRTMRGGSWYFTNVLVFRSFSRFGAVLGGTLPFPGVGIRCVRTRP